LEYEEGYRVYVLDKDKMYIFENIASHMNALDFEDRWRGLADHVVSTNKLRPQPRGKKSTKLKPIAETLSTFKTNAMPTSKKRLAESPLQDPKPSKQIRQKPPTNKTKWEKGRIIVINPPPDNPELFWIAQIIAKKGLDLEVRWFDRAADGSFVLGSTDEIPCASVYEMLQTVVQMKVEDTYVLKNEAEVVTFINQFKALQN